MRTGSFYPSRVTRWVIGIILGLLVLIPLAMTLEYTFRDGKGHSLKHWAALFDPANKSTYSPLWTGVTNSLILAVATIVIVLVLIAPTMILVTVKFPHLRRVFEFVALLPITIPAIVLVVGLSPIYLFIGRSVGTGAWTLCFAYGILALPFAFRAIQASIDATNVTTLAEAARSLGASWLNVIVRVLAPNLRSGLMAGSLISVAVVLGEYTIASLLNRQNLQTSLVVVNQQDAFIAVIVSLLALAFCFILLLVIGQLGRMGSARKERS